MDGVVDVNMAVALSNLGALGVLNLEGVQTRYENPEHVLNKIQSTGKEDFVPLMQEIYKQPIKEELILKRIQEIKEGGGIAAVSGTPIAAIKFRNLIKDSGADLFFLQATVVSTEHLGKKGSQNLDLYDLCKNIGIPVAVGNCVTYEVSLKLMRAGAAAVMVGIGPGAACTSRGVLGVGIPQATAISDCSAAREDFKKESGKYVPIIADGGIITGGDISKCIACGADSVMIGSPIARSQEAVGTTGSLKSILCGPAILDDGTHNLLGALKTSMGTLGATNIKEMQKVEVVVAPSLLTEGKVYQKAQQLGMGK